jgi:hypothetical protein
LVWLAGSARRLGWLADRRPMVERVRIVAQAAPTIKVDTTFDALQCFQMLRLKAFQ